MKELTRQLPRLRVGFECLYGYSHAYQLVDGAVSLAHCVPGEVLNRTENERTHDLVTTLQQQFHPQFHIKAFGRNYECFCTFRGGGDVHIFVNDATSSAAVLHTTGGEEAEATATCVPPTDPAPNLTPPKEGKVPVWHHGK